MTETDTDLPTTDRGSPLPDWCGSLDLALAEAWRRLVRGARDRRHAFHTLTVATIRPDGAPTARTVVLRGTEPDRRVLRFHTDRRSPKLIDLAGDARVGLLLYDPGAKLQLRIDGRATVLADGDLPDGLWQRTRPQSRTCYRQPAAPGAPLDVPLLPIPDERDPLDGRENFTAVEVAVLRLDLLYLHIAGHRRAVFDWTGGGLSSGWAAP